MDPKSLPLLVPGWGIPPAWYRSALEPVFPGLEILEPGFFGVGEQFDGERFSARLTAALAVPRTVVAHSLGTMFALRAAAENPTVKALLLFSPFARFTAAENYSGRPVRDVRAMLAQLRRDPVTLLENFIRSVYAPEPMPDGRSITESPAAESLRAGLQCLLEMDVRPWLDRVRCPVLLLQGEADAISGDGQSSVLAGQLKTVESVVIAGRGHALPLTGVADWEPRVTAFRKIKKVS